MNNTGYEVLTDNGYAKLNEAALCLWAKRLGIENVSGLKTYLHEHRRADISFQVLAGHMAGYYEHPQRSFTVRNSPV